MGNHKKAVYHERVKNQWFLLLFLCGMTSTFFWAKPFLSTKTFQPKESPQSIKLEDYQPVQLSVRRDNQAQPVRYLTVEVVVSDWAIEQGLSGRSVVPADGLLFVMPERSVPRFWMKEMLFNLDIVWIDGMTIVDITNNVPAPDPKTPFSELPVYSPNQPVTAVLEIPAGQAQQYNLQIGDILEMTTL